MTKPFRLAGQDLADQFRKMEDALMPAGTRMMRDMQKNLGSAAFDAVGKGASFDAVSKAFSASRMSIGDVGANSAVGMLAKNNTAMDAIKAATAGLVPRNTFPLQDFFRDNALFANISSQAALGRTFEKMLPHAGYDLFASKIEKMFAPPIFDVASSFGKTIGILSPVPDEESASIVWGSEETKLRFGALVPAQEESEEPTLVISAEVYCKLCDSLVLAESELNWSSPYRVIVRSNIIPLCEGCTEKYAGNPEAFRKALLGALKKGPVLAIKGSIKGGGQGDGVARGQLRLVYTKKDPKKP